MERIQTLSEAAGKKMEFTGKAFYPPGVLAAYCILTNLPLGIFLFGINVYRRGNISAGRITMLLCAVAIVAQSIALALGAKVFDLRILLLNIVVGLGLMKSENARYEKAVLAGARTAKWWPPLLFVAANMLAIYVLSRLLG